MAICAQLKPGAARIDLDGHAAGVVTEDEAKAGAGKARKAEGAPAPRREAAPPRLRRRRQTNVRLSIDKLREAARERARTGVSHA